MTEANADMEFEREKAKFDTYMSGRMCLLLEANRNINDGNETMELCLEGVWRQLEQKFREWCDELTE